MVNSEDLSDARSAQHERIVEILVYILDEMRKKQQLADIDLGTLAQRGFSQTEISTAFSWLFERMEGSGVERVVAQSDLPRQSLLKKRPPSESIRVYHEVERSVLSSEAQGYLLQLRELGLLTDAEIESIIDRIMMSGVAPVSAGMVKELVAGLIFDFDESNRIVGRQMLDSQDTVH
jgi:uncharacterized protein Smg (DUF494 family)